MSNTVYLVASGDLRLSANQLCWPAQQATEDALQQTIINSGHQVIRAHPISAEKKHGFIDSQKYGIEVFRGIPSDAPVIVLEAVWQYSHHVLAGLFHHRGPILTIANWSGQWPGLVGMLNLNGSLTKAGVPYATLWSENFTDDYFVSRLEAWLGGKPIEHSLEHVKTVSAYSLPQAAQTVGSSVAHRIKDEKAILGIFDEGCMGMYNAIIPDELLHPMGIFKERLSQSALYAAMRIIPDQEAEPILQWLKDKGMQFHTGKDPKTELTEDQLLDQCRMYIASLRIADNFGCASIGIQYQQGLKDLTPASDLVEGLLNNVDRPPVRSLESDLILFADQALPHFNEVDECAGVDALVTNRVWKELGLAPETTLHDIRFGEDYDGEFVWVFEISGAAPPEHFVGGYEGASSERQPPMYFPLGGGTLKGISKAGEIVWSRIYVEDNRLKVDMGRGSAVELPSEEVERRWKLTTSQWPMMNATLRGVTKNQLMGRHKANHIQVAYGKDAASADMALAAKAKAFQDLGIEVFLCGDLSFAAA